MTCQFWGLWWHFLTVKGNCCFWWCCYTSVWSDHHISSFYLIWEMTSQFWGLWSHFLTVKGNCCFWWCCYTSEWSDHHISSLCLVWEMTSQFWVQCWRFWGNGILLFLIMFLYIIVVRSSYIIIVSGMGDDIPILGAVVTLFDGKGALLYCYTRLPSEL